MAHTCRALKEEQAQDGADEDKAESREGRLQSTLAHPTAFAHLTVVPGPVPLDELNVDRFCAAMHKLHDPVPRPVGTDASGTLVAVFTRFLRHSMEPERLLSLIHI